MKAYLYFSRFGGFPTLCKIKARSRVTLARKIQEILPLFQADGFKLSYAYVYSKGNKTCNMSNYFYGGRI